MSTVRNLCPHHVRMSEIMLRQTRLTRVIGYFRRWLKRFPDIDDAIIDLETVGWIFEFKDRK